MSVTLSNAEFALFILWYALFLGVSFIFGVRSGARRMLKQIEVIYAE